MDGASLWSQLTSDLPQYFLDLLDTDNVTSPNPLISATPSNISLASILLWPTWYRHCYFSRPLNFRNVIKHQSCLDTSSTYLIQTILTSPNPWISATPLLLCASAHQNTLSVWHAAGAATTLNPSRKRYAAKGEKRGNVTLLGLAQTYICAVYDRMYADFPAKNNVPFVHDQFVTTVSNI